MANKLKILAISSPGGHWIQLNKICNPMDKQFNILYVTPGSRFTSKKNDRRVKNIIDASADSKYKVIILGFQLLKLLLIERPQYIISTGAAPGAVIFMLAKWFPAKTIWIDSIANVNTLSRSGKMIKKHADLVLSQWEQLSNGKDILFKGSLL